MTTSKRWRRAGSLWALAALLTFSGMLAGCKRDAAETEADEAEEVAYTMGEPLADSSLAVVVTSEYGSDTLTTDLFLQQYNLVLQQFPGLEGDPEQSREVRRRMVEEFVLSHLLRGEVNNLKLPVDTAKVNQQLAMIKQQFPSLEAYQQALASDGLTEDSLRSSIGDLVRQQALQERYAEAAGTPTPADLEAFRKERAQQVSAQHILFMVPPGTPAAQKEEIQTRARAVLDSAKSGADFAALARRHSDDGSAEQGGDLGYFSRGDMVPAFEKAVFALSDSGDVGTDLVRTQFGYHIVRLTGRRTAELMDTTTARQMLVRERQQDAVEAGVNALKKKATVRINPTVVDADLNAPLEM